MERRVKGGAVAKGDHFRNSKKELEGRLGSLGISTKLSRFGGSARCAENEKKSASAGELTEKGSIGAIWARWSAAALDLCNILKEGGEKRKKGKSVTKGTGGNQRSH